MNQGAKVCIGLTEYQEKENYYIHMNIQIHLVSSSCCLKRKSQMLGIHVKTLTNVCT